MYGLDIKNSVYQYLAMMAERLIYAIRDINEISLVGIAYTSSLIYFCVYLITIINYKRHTDLNNSLGLLPPACLVRSCWRGRGCGGGAGRGGLGQGLRGSSR